MNASTLSYTAPTVKRPPLVLGLAATIPNFVAAVMMIVAETSATPSPILRQYIPLFLGLGIGMAICMAYMQYQYAQSMKAASQRQPLDAFCPSPLPFAPQPYNEFQHHKSIVAVVFMIIAGLCSLAILVISVADLAGKAVPLELMQARFLFMTGFMLFGFMSMGITYFNARYRANDGGATQRPDLSFDDQLRKLAALRKDGIISDAELADARQRILAKLGA